LLDFGVIETTPKIPLKDKILEVASDLESLISLYHPERVVIEKLFFNTNITTGIDVSHMRGVIMYQFAKRGIEILEYTPLELKSAIC
jgi:crossover junction endodeoxyribonuclease RuvC